MKRLTDGEREVLAELEADARALADLGREAPPARPAAPPADPDPAGPEGPPW